MKPTQETLERYLAFMRGKTSNQSRLSSGDEMTARYVIEWVPGFKETPPFATNDDLKTVPDDKIEN